ncbi:HA1F protein, partial [Dromaius novaehollandiae]|nr:HA1F protein [Dromaius novaehollandiae]
QPLSPRLPGCVSGYHTLQRVYGCDLLEDGSIRGFQQDAYDGKDFIAFDNDMQTFVVADAAALITKTEWEADGAELESWKHYLENTCIKGLRRYVEHGRAALERRERPAVRVSAKESHGFVTLSCRAH